MPMFTPRRIVVVSCLLLSVSWVTSACKPQETTSPPTAASAAAPSVAASMAAPASQNTPAPQLTSMADAVLAAHRQMIVLMHGERSLKPAERRAVGAVGQMLFHDMQQRVDTLTTAATALDPAVVGAVNTLLD